MTNSTNPADSTDPTRLHTARDSFQAAYDDLLDTADSLPESLRVKSGAHDDDSPRTMLAKLAGWLAEAKRRFRRYPEGTGHIVYNDAAFDSVAVWQRQDDDYETILDELRTHIADLLTLIDTIPLRLQDDERYQEWLQRLTTSADHYRAALQDFRQSQQAE